ncbi:MAG TPA: DNA methyltransferase [Symbiobacteriaceae bacterium]|nr:DNA methyltransferase [Symbiobacteriaceae bacterium]
MAAILIERRELGPDRILQTQTNKEKHKIMTNEIRTPKRSPEGTWYDFHACYSEEFVEDVLTHLRLRPSETVLDPWNGTGTTTKVAAERNFRAIGFDMNPVMVVVAKARLYAASSASSSEMAREVVNRLIESYSQGDPLVAEDDPLNTWFTASGVNVIRHLEGATQHQAGSDVKVPSPSVPVDVEALTPQQSLLYVAIFQTVRSFLTRFQGSNPTWIKAPKSDSQKVSPSATEINLEFSKNLERLLSLLNQPARTTTTEIPASVRLGVANSRSLPVPSNSVDAVICSPPYCTRIDYVVATKPELAMLRIGDKKSIRRLRNNMLGTPTISKIPPQQTIKWGPTAGFFLKQVAAHSSKASASYYLKGFLQYFDGVCDSLEELNRVVRPGAQLAFVVQDSYYKNIHLDLPQVYRDMAQILGWGLADQFNYPVTRSIAQVNKGTKLYRGKTPAIESALVFRKA